MNDVIRAEFTRPNIVEIILEDRLNHNTFSTNFIEGLTRVFKTLPLETKVVVIYGYENYFCCGGTQEELLKACKGEISFNDYSFYRLLLDCEIPTIAAMQGHALGGGLVFGCYADMIVMAEESIYSANFMKYGFTPGMGATYILPKKLGTILADEMMYSAKNYQGGELKERNVSIKVVKKNEVISTALSLANELVDKPLESLKLLKRHRVQAIKAELSIILEQELAMHEITFKLPEVKQRIIKLF